MAVKSNSKQFSAEDEIPLFHRDNLFWQKKKIILSLKVRMNISENSMPGSAPGFVPGSVPGSCVCHFNYSSSQAGSVSRSSLITASQILTPPKASEKCLSELARLSLPYPLPEKLTQAHNAPHITAVRCLRPCKKRTVAMPAKRLTSCGGQDIINLLDEAENI